MKLEKQISVNFILFYKLLIKRKNYFLCMIKAYKLTESKCSICIYNETYYIVFIIGYNVKKILNIRNYLKRAIFASGTYFCVFGYLVPKISSAKYNFVRKLKYP